MKHFRFVMFILLITVIIQLLVIALCLKEIRERQIYTTGRIDQINNYCLE